MIYEVIPIQERGSAPDTKLTVYIQHATPSLAADLRPLVLITPGGGYSHTSDREAEPVALAFLAKGYHAAVLRYSCAPATDPTQRLELARAVRIVREHADAWRVDADRIVLWGASAGGHLACHYACTWHDELSELAGCSGEELSIGGLMLSYPVISAGPKTHGESIANLLGERREDEGERRRVSLETRINGHVPPVFVWHTWTDESVPVENSLLLAQALKEQGISAELHIFPQGPHGIALADWRTMSQDRKEDIPCCHPWIDLATAWLDRLRIGEG